MITRLGSRRWSLSHCGVTSSFARAFCAAAGEAAMSDIATMWESFTVGLIEGGESNATGHLAPAGPRSMPDVSGKCHRRPRSAANAIPDLPDRQDDFRIGDVILEL